MEVLVDSEGLAEPEADSVRTVTAVTGIPAMEEKNSPVHISVAAQVVSLISLFGHRGRGQSSAGFRGQDYNAELQLSLREAAETHKQVLNVNGKNIRITVPAGIANGQTIKLRGHGAPGVNGGPAGDLYITFVIPDDPVFKRLGNDLYIHAPLSLYTAVLGGEETVDTLNGKVKLKVKPETQNGTKVRLKGKGFPVYKEEGKFGDLIVTYNVTIPSNLTEHQKELFRQLKDSSN